MVLLKTNNELIIIKIRAAETETENLNTGFERDV